MSRNSGSVATSYATRAAPSTRVHNNTPSAVGSNEAMPCGNVRSCASSVAQPPTTDAAVDAARHCRNVRRAITVRP
jgi:hypothetical protein